MARCYRNQSSLSVCCYTLCIYTRHFVQLCKCTVPASRSSSPKRCNAVPWSSRLARSRGQASPKTGFKERIMRVKGIWKKKRKQFYYRLHCAIDRSLKLNTSAEDDAYEGAIRDMNPQRELSQPKEASLMDAAGAYRRPSQGLPLAEPVSRNYRISNMDTLLETLKTNIVSWI